jgi:hypothetical protein
LFPDRSTVKYSVTLQIPEDCYDEVLLSLHEEVFITEINGVRTRNGQQLEQKFAEMDGVGENTPSCTIS